MMVNVDLSATVFYSAGPLPGIAAQFLGRRSLDELCRGISDRDLQKLDKFLKNIKIQVIHRGDKKFKFKISKLTPSSADRTTFKDQAGNEMTVADYFFKQYNKRLNYSFLPCVVIKKDIFLPMEVCEVLPGHCYNKKLNDEQTIEMIKLNCQKPNVHANKIIQGVSLLQHKDNPYLQRFDMSVKPEMAVINARVLPTPKISFHASAQDAEFSPKMVHGV